MLAKVPRFCCSPELAKVPRLLFTCAGQSAEVLLFTCADQVMGFADGFLGVSAVPITRVGLKLMTS